MSKGTHEETMSNCNLRTALKEIMDHEAGPYFGSPEEAMCHEILVLKGIAREALASQCKFKTRIIHLRELLKGDFRMKRCMYYSFEKCSLGINPVEHFGPQEGWMKRAPCFGPDRTMICEFSEYPSEEEKIDEK